MKNLYIEFFSGSSDSVCIMVCMLFFRRKSCKKWGQRKKELKIKEKENQNPPAKEVEKSEDEIRSNRRLILFRRRNRFMLSGATKTNKDSKFRVLLLSGNIFPSYNLIYAYNILQRNSYRLELKQNDMMVMMMIIIKKKGNSYYIYNNGKHWLNKLRLKNLSDKLGLLYKITKE